METLNLIGWGFFVVLRFGGLYYLNPGEVFEAKAGAPFLK